MKLDESESRVLQEWLDRTFEGLALVGRGSQGVVHRGRHLGTDREIILKLSPVVDPTIEEELRREARALSKIDHPRVVQLLDFGVIGRMAWFLFPFVPGETLRDRLIHGPVPWRTVASIGGQLLSALEHIHALGVLHRDLKPENIWLGQEGQALLLDFGTSRLQELTSITHGFIKGTPGYMAPEQALGEAVDQRTDLHSLGRILFEMLRGNNPYQKDSFQQCLELAVNLRPQDLPPVPAGTPRKLHLLLLQLLEFAPADRPPDARSVRLHLEDILQEAAAPREILPPGPVTLPDVDPRQTAPLDRTRPLARDGALPGYESLSILGVGGMGIVHRARQLSLKREVALKILDRPLDDGEIAQRFHREMKTHVNLSHPHLVKVYDAGVAGGLPYIAMELVDGGTLADRFMDTGYADPAWLRKVLLEVGEALVYLHAAGIQHRDLKPGNVLVAGDRVLKVSDFGLVRGPLDVSLTATNQVLGTPRYLAPELVAGRDVGSPADLYSLGVMAYYLASGEFPTPGYTLAEYMAQVVRSDPIPLASKIDSIPGFLEQLIMQLLHRDPTRRPTAAELVGQLRERPGWNRPVPSPAPTEVVSFEAGSDKKHAVRDGRRQPWLLIAALLIGAILAVLPSREVVRPAPASSHHVAGPQSPVPVEPGRIPAPLSTVGRGRPWRAVDEIRPLLGGLSAANPVKPNLETFITKTGVDPGPRAEAWLHWAALVDWFEGGSGMPPPRTVRSMSGLMDVVTEEMFESEMIPSVEEDPGRSLGRILWTLALFPDDGRLWLGLGWWLDRQEEVRSSRIAYRQAFEGKMPRPLPNSPRAVWSGLWRSLALGGKDLAHEWKVWVPDGSFDQAPYDGLSAAVEHEESRYRDVLSRLSEDPRHGPWPGIRLASHLLARHRIDPALECLSRVPEAMWNTPHVVLIRLACQMEGGDPLKTVETLMGRPAEWDILATRIWRDRVLEAGHPAALLRLLRTAAADPGRMREDEMAAAGMALVDAGGQDPWLDEWLEKKYFDPGLAGATTRPPEGTATLFPELGLLGRPGSRAFLRRVMEGSPSLQDPRYRKNKQVLISRWSSRIGDDRAALEAWKLVADDPLPVDRSALAEVACRTLWRERRGHGPLPGSETYLGAGTGPKKHEEFETARKLRDGEYESAFRHSVARLRTGPVEPFWLLAALWAADLGGLDGELDDLLVRAPHLAHEHGMGRWIHDEIVSLRRRPGD